MNKYDQVKLNVMIKAIQENTVKLLDPKFKQTLTAATYARRASEINEMRSSVISRLLQMDRSLPEFFPIGSYVEYKPPDDPESWKPNPVLQGRVHSYLARWILLEIPGQEGLLQVDPRCLTLRFIRKNL